MDLPRSRRRYRVVDDIEEIQEEPLPIPTPAQAVVEITHAGRSKLALGSELIGQVIGAGPLAQDWIGRRVVVPRLLPCGECDACRRNAIGRCPAAVGPEGLLSHRVVPARFLLDPINANERSPVSLLALIDALSTPYSGLARAGLQAGDTLVCFGDDSRSQAIQPLAEYLSAKLASASTSAAVVARRLVATSPQEAALALSFALPGDVVVLLDGDIGSTAERTIPDVTAGDLSVLTQGPVHPDLLPELDALVASGALDLAEVGCEVDFGTFLRLHSGPRLSWASLPR